MATLTYVQKINVEVKGNLTLIVKAKRTMWVWCPTQPRPMFNLNLTKIKCIANINDLKLKGNLSLTRKVVTTYVQYDFEWIMKIWQYGNIDQLGNVSLVPDSISTYVQYNFD